MAELEIQELPVEKGAASALARLRAETGLRMPDCCVLHAALTAGAQALATCDVRLARAAATKGFQTP
ncbi:MAG: PIN domain-containing protein [Solirubrobacteraceae bacterium]